MTIPRNRSAKYNALPKRYKRRHRHPSRPCKKLRQLWALMELFYSSNACDIYTVDFVKRKLAPLIPYLKRRYELVFLKVDPDFRSGFETYGYSNPLTRLHYISDRWDCSFRVRWLINLVEPDYAPNIKS